MPAVPPLSVLMPLYNNAAYFPSAVESILNQSFSDFELIVIDDASQDGSPALLRSYARQDSRIRPIFLKKNRNLVGVSNEGLKQARAPLIARMDSDDFSLPQRFEKQMAFMKHNPEVGMVGCSYFRFRGSPDSQRVTVRLPSLKGVSARSFSYRTVLQKMCYASSVYRREIGLAIGGYRAFFKKGGEDGEFVLRMQERTKIINLPDVLYGYRKNPSSLSVQNADAIDAAHLLGCLCALKRRRGFLDPLERAQPLTRLPQELGLPVSVTLEELQNDPRWAVALMRIWLKGKHVSRVEGLYLHARLLRVCLRRKIGLGSLGRAVKAIEAAA